MHFICHPSLGLRGTVAIAGSKSHTIRALMIAALADGQSCLHAPLISADAQAAVRAIQALGATVTMHDCFWQVHGRGIPRVNSAMTIDVANSGTTLNLLMGIAALTQGSQLRLTGDAQIQRRPSAALAQALVELGARVKAERNNGCAPFLIEGPLVGGRTTMHCQSSQYLSSLLLACPLAKNDSVIDVPLLNEKPYVQMTLDWLTAQQIEFDANADLSHFRLRGNQQYKPFERRIPADFSTATFFLGAAALANNDITCTGLDMNDTQADKKVVSYLQQMGADVQIDASGIRIGGGKLHGVELDMNETPDALPVMAVLACFADSTTVLFNVEHARIKETDRIAVMAAELRKMGAVIDERPDGLIIQPSCLHAATVDGHDDHRVVMALALAAMHAESGPTTITTAESAAVTVPDFVERMQMLGGNIQRQ